MKKTILKLAAIMLPLLSTAQVGINNENPLVTLDVEASSTNTGKLDGLLPPRITGEKLKSQIYTRSDNKTTGTIIYVTEAVANPSGETINVTREGHYTFDGEVWKSLVSRSENDYGAQDYILVDEDVLDTEVDYKEYFPNVLSFVNYYEMFSYEIRANASTGNWEIKVHMYDRPGSSGPIEGAKVYFKIMWIKKY